MRFKEGQCKRAIDTFFATMYCTAAALKWLPCTVGKSASLSRGSASHAFIVAETYRVIGVQRSLRPFPIHRTCAPLPSVTEVRSRPISSESLKPVWTASNNKAWSRRPIHVDRSGDLSSASISVLNPENAPSYYRTCWVSPILVVLAHCVRALRRT